MTKRPFAVFDIDGTLLRWQLYHAVADELAKRGKLDLKGYDRVRRARMLWKKRPHHASYADYEQTLIDFFEKAITDVEPSELIDACRTVVDAYKDQVYAYTRDLIGELKSKNYLLFAISASQDEIVKMLAKYYGFDDAAGSIYEVKDGSYTGKSSILKAGKKPEMLRELVKKHHASLLESVGVGDSEGDVEMLKEVAQPIAFNPTKELFEIAKQNGWRVIVERKNMIYNLEPGNGKYTID